MPYAIRKINDHFNVIKKETGETVSEHDTRDKAVKAIRAIYAHENSPKPDHRWFR